MIKACNFTSFFGTTIKYSIVSIYHILLNSSPTHLDDFRFPLLKMMLLWASLSKAPGAHEYFSIVIHRCRITMSNGLQVFIFKDTAK